MILCCFDALPCISEDLVRLFEVGRCDCACATGCCIACNLSQTIVEPAGCMLSCRFSSAGFLHLLATSLMHLNSDQRPPFALVPQSLGTCGSMQMPSNLFCTRSLCGGMDSRVSLHAFLPWNICVMGVHDFTASHTVAADDPSVHHLCICTLGLHPGHAVAPFFASTMCRQRQESDVGSGS